MKRIRFTERRVYETHGPGHPDNPAYEADAEYDLSDELADRWIRRGAAVQVERVASRVYDPRPPVPPAPPAPPPTRAPQQKAKPTPAAKE